MTADWMIYGANGYTGRLIAAEAGAAACGPRWLDARRRQSSP